MSFKEFDMSEYFNVLETFKQEHENEIVKYYGSIEKYDKILETMKSKELEGAKMAIKENVDVYLAQADQLMKRLTFDLSKSPSSPDIQEIVKEMDDMVIEHSKIVKMDMGENYWGLMADLYLTKCTKVHDKKYGKGATNFLGEALMFYCENVK